MTLDEHLVMNTYVNSLRRPSETALRKKNSFLKKTLNWRERNFTVKEPLDLSLQTHVIAIKAHRLKEAPQSILKGSKMRRSRSKVEIKQSPSSSSLFEHKRQFSVLRHK